MLSSWPVRHTIALVVFPVMVVIMIPAWIGRNSETVLTVPASPHGWVALVGGAVALLSGIALFVASLRRFGTDGRGTLAPWDPPTRLVVTGPYSFVRNPMISGVILLLLGEGLVLRSVPHLLWTGVFFVINSIYIPLLEEPRLRSRFGSDYEEYRRAVPRLLPRLRPWKPTGGRGTGAS